MHMVMVTPLSYSVKLCVLFTLNLFLCKTMKGVTTYDGHTRYKTSCNNEHLFPKVEWSSTFRESTATLQHIFQILRGVIDLQHVLQSPVNCFLTAKAIQVTRNNAPCYIRLSIRDVLSHQNCEARWKKSCLTLSLPRGFPLTSKIVWR